MILEEPEDLKQGPEICGQSQNASSLSPGSFGGPELRLLLDGLQTAQNVCKESLNFKFNIHLPAPVWRESTACLTIYNS